MAAKLSQDHSGEEVAALPRAMLFTEAIKQRLRQRLRRIPGLRYLYHTLRLVYYMIFKTDSFSFVHMIPPGHYYSPIPDLKEISAREPMLLDREVVESSGIDLKEEAQLRLLENFSYYYDEVPFPETPKKTARYYYNNEIFRHGDAIPLYSVLRHYEPRRVIEIGSGFSSAAMLDVNDRFLGNRCRFTFVEPYPKRLFTLLARGDRQEHTILEKKVQDVPLEVFRALSANDILFVDSSHVVKVGSDVTHILFKVLPELRPGVIIHFHDIFWPFDYPKECFLKGWAWNEAYFLRSFLQFNTSFEILYFNSFIAAHHEHLLRGKMPLCLQSPGSSLWLKKVS